MADAPAIQDMVSSLASLGEMLPRPLAEIYEQLRDFLVVRDDGRLVACAALHIMWEDLAEIRSVAVLDEWRDKGVGAQLVESCLEEARALGITTVFALTRQPNFFERLGFHQADVMALPRKVWGECFRCPKFPNCDEVAVIIEFKAPPVS
ncbi:MAG: N-acetyltransferase [Dehalococcoidia bacterium]|nr:MAG: N-acetyltransferase [Dehalococcoidia bacterium]